MSKIKDELEKELRKISVFLDEESGDINFEKVKDSADSYNEVLLKALCEKLNLRKQFFKKVGDVEVFHVKDFKLFIDKNRIFNSYTQYKNKIGLANKGGYINEDQKVVLNFPFKDAVLEGGQAKEDAVRDETFFNEILAKDEIDRLLDKKALVNWKRLTEKGSTSIKQIQRDMDGFVSDNMIIKGNNLLALHSLESQFSERVKLIYIDPPYNTGNDDFNYNDRFNHATWLTFMKNRLSVAYRLLRDDGSIFIQVDHHELGYLNVLMDEIFGIENKVQVISVKTASPSGFKAVNPGPIDVTEYILFYTKNKARYKFKKGYVPVDYNSNYNLYIEDFEKDASKWKFTPIKEKVLKESCFKKESDLKNKFGDSYKIILQKLIADFAFKNAERVISVRDLHKPTETVRELQEKSRNNNEKLIPYKKKDGTFMYLYKGGALAFYINKINEIDGEKQVTELLSDFWSHISWAGIAREGGVKLKNGKKPEKLLKQILEISTEKGDLVLDYHLGSGTTASVAHKMGRQYIGIEQLDYGEDDSVLRLQNVIKGDSTGISKSVNWNGGGEFLFTELAKWNEKAKELVVKAKTLKELEMLLKVLCEQYFIDYNVRVSEFKKVVKEDEFKKLSLPEQKKIFVDVLDLNQMYVNASEMNDAKYGIAKEDQKLTKEFYK